MLMIAANIRAGPQTVATLYLVLGDILHENTFKQSMLFQSTQIMFTPFRVHRFSIIITKTTIKDFYPWRNSPACKV